MRTVMLATDGSPTASKATSLAIELSAALGATLHVVSVWSAPTFDYAYVPSSYTPELMRAAREGAERALADAVAAGEAAGVTVTTDVRDGDARSEICTAAEEVSADLLVLGAHGWGAMGRMLFGSVSTAVLHHAPCPVLVVRGGPAEEPEPEAVGAATSRSDG